MQGSWTTGSGVVAQPLTWSDASRCISLVFRHSFPRRAALEGLADTILKNLPNTVHVVNPAKKKLKQKRK